MPKLTGRHLQGRLLSHLPADASAVPISFRDEAERVVAQGHVSALIAAINGRKAQQPPEILRSGKIPVFGRKTPDTDTQRSHYKRFVTARIDTLQELAKERRLTLILPKLYTAQRDLQELREGLKRIERDTQSQPVIKTIGLAQQQLNLLIPLKLSALELRLDLTEQMRKGVDRAGELRIVQSTLLEIEIAIREACDYIRYGTDILMADECDEGLARRLTEAVEALNLKVQTLAGYQPVKLSGMQFEPALADLAAQVERGRPLLSQVDPSQRFTNHDLEDLTEQVFAEPVLAVAASMPLRVTRTSTHHVPIGTAKPSRSRNNINGVAPPFATSAALTFSTVNPLINLTDASFAPSPGSPSRTPPYRASTWTLPRTPSLRGLSLIEGGAEVPDAATVPVSDLRRRGSRPIQTPRSRSGSIVNAAGGGGTRRAASGRLNIGSSGTAIPMPRSIKDIIVAKPPRALSPAQHIQSARQAQYRNLLIFLFAIVAAVAAGTVFFGLYELVRAVSPRSSIMPSQGRAYSPTASPEAANNTISPYVNATASYLPPGSLVPNVTALYPASNASITASPETSISAVPGFASQTQVPNSQAPAATSQFPSATSQIPSATSQAPAATSQVLSATSQAPAATSQIPAASASNSLPAASASASPLPPSATATPDPLVMISINRGNTVLVDWDALIAGAPSGIGTVTELCITPIAGASVQWQINSITQAPSVPFCITNAQIDAGQVVTLSTAADTTEHAAKYVADTNQTFTLETRSARRLLSVGDTLLMNGDRIAETIYVVPAFSATPLFVHGHLRANATHSNSTHCLG